MNDGILRSDGEPTKIGLHRRDCAGEHDAREALLSHLRPALVAFCRRYMRNLHSAEDAAQEEVLLKLSGDRHWPSENFRAWLFRVTRNHCLERVRRRQDGREGVYNPAPG